MTDWREDCQRLLFILQHFRKLKAIKAIRLYGWPLLIVQHLSPKLQEPYINFCYRLAS